MYNAVGIDVSKGRSTVTVLQPGGVVIHKPFDVLHTSKDLNQLSAYLGSLDGDTKIVMAAKANLIALLDNIYPGVYKLFDSPVRDDGSQKWVDYAYSFWHVDCVRKIGLKTFTER